MKNIGIALTALALTAAVPLAATAGSLTGGLGGSVGGAGGSLGGGLSGGASLGGDKASGVTAGAGATVGAAVQAPAVTTPSADSLPSTAAAASAVTVNSKGRITNLTSVSSADLAAYFAAQGYTLASSFHQTAENTLEASAQLSGTPVTIDIDAHGNVTVE